MPRLPGIGQKDAVRVLEKSGFAVIRQGKHITMSDGVRIVQIPRHNPINSFTMGKIAQDAGFTPDQFRKLL
jgi:predicted RNA binding protein YcfA (HicA-like mRNA interferase family)